MSDEIRRLVQQHFSSSTRSVTSLGGGFYGRDYYRPVAERTLKKAETLLARGELDQKTCAVVERAVDQFDRIFYLPITQAGLVHGDYNTWNILLDRDLRHVAGSSIPAQAEALRRFLI